MLGRNNLGTVSCVPKKIDWHLTYYARGKERLRASMTSAIHIVADLETPTRQCTKVAVPSSFPLPIL